MNARMNIFSMLEYWKWQVVLLTLQVTVIFFNPSMSSYGPFIGVDRIIRSGSRFCVWKIMRTSPLEMI